MMKSQAQLKQKAQEIAVLLGMKYHTGRIFLIGSASTGNVHSHSDIDLVVESLPPELYIKALSEAQDRLPDDMELNLIPFEDAFESLKQKTLRKGLLIYG